MTLFLLARPYHKPEFIIQADCTKLAKQLCGYYGGYLKVVTEANVDISTYINEEKYIVKYKDIVLKTSSPLFDINRIIAENTSYDAEFLALHGAAVGYNGSAYVFLAATTGGKTTLTAYLTSRGMSYLTDDCVLYHKKTREIHPCTTPIHLREGGVEVLKKHGIELDFEYVDDGELQRFAYTPKSIETKALSIAGIYFLSRSDTPNDNTCVKINSTTALKKLMESVMPGYKVTGEHLKTLIGLANTGCYEVNYHDMEYVESVVNG